MIKSVRIFRMLRVLVAFPMRRLWDREVSTKQERGLGDGRWEMEMEMEMYRQHSMAGEADTHEDG